jgi:hypothetical protein
MLLAIGNAIEFIQVAHFKRDQRWAGY